MLDDEHINRVNCCQTAQIKEEIDAISKGFDTMIDERERGLSSGQKQRLLIARVLYRNPRFLFLDEATNSLDNINEKKIVDALSSAFENRTVVVIAHRLSTICNADQIIVMDQGRIVEVGSHETLMKQQTYYQFVASQSEKIQIQRNLSAIIMGKSGTKFIPNYVKRIIFN